MELISFKLYQLWKLNGREKKPLSNFKNKIDYTVTRYKVVNSESTNGV
jgi:hypothetical protein